MAALSVLAATKPNQTEPNQTKGCQKYTAKNGERKAIRQGGCDGFGHISKGERVKRARGTGEGERGSSARWSEIFAGELVSGKYLRYFHLATEWFMTPCSLYSCCCCCCCCWCCRHLANPNTKRHRSWVFASFAAG